jgi:hypothetical protein
MRALGLLALLALASLAPALSRAADISSQVLLAPISADRAAAYDWGVVVLTDIVPARGSASDVGNLRVNKEIGTFFADGYAIYSLTPVPTAADSTAMMLIMVRPKK